MRNISIIKNLSFIVCVTQFCDIQNNRMHIKRQSVMTNFFGKRSSAEPPEDYVELVQEVQNLEETLKMKQNELFQILRNIHKRKVTHPRKRKETATFIRTGEIIRSTLTKEHKKNLELVSMLTDVEVKSFVKNGHCCIVYAFEHNFTPVQHSLRISINKDHNKISHTSLPLGFDLRSVIEEYNEVLKPDCLGAIRKALIAYYNRQQQFECLKDLLYLEGYITKSLDSSHIEVTFSVQHVEYKHQANVTLSFKYHAKDIRPSTISFESSDMPEGNDEALLKQSEVFKKKPLHEAFKKAFIEGGPYRLPRETASDNVATNMDTTHQFKRRRPKKRFRRNNHCYNIDDTFQPDDCTDQSEDTEVDDE